MSPPVFVVVGHPNKGKSSIVSTLAQDDRVEISPVPGTTVHRSAFPMRVDGRLLYTLVDTPGFQRPRDVLRWLQQHATSVVEHPEVVRRFVVQHAGNSRYTAECELLQPIMDGGGILYVVDGSVPFASEYEPEMEILRWTGAPSMALINPIGQERYITQWEVALGQYFKIVRVFNAMTAEFDKRIALLHGFGQLREGWQQPMELAVADLMAERARQTQRATDAIARMLLDMLRLSVATTLPHNADPKDFYGTLEEKYKHELRRIEQHSRDTVQQIYQHHRLQREETEATSLLGSLLEEDLFAEATWRLFGQTKWQLTMVGAASGATVGSVIDASVGGASFLLGATIGAVVGGTLGWQAATWSGTFYVSTLPAIDVLGFGGKRLQCGPTTNRNLPYVALGRARWHHRMVVRRTHAQRQALTLDLATPHSGTLNPLQDNERRRLEHVFSRIRKAADSERALDLLQELRDLIHPLLLRNESF